MAHMTVSETNRAGAIHTVPNTIIILILKIFSPLTCNGDVQKILGYLWFFSAILMTFRGSGLYPYVLEIFTVVVFAVVSGK